MRALTPRGRRRAVVVVLAVAVGTGLGACGTGSDAPAAGASATSSTPTDVAADATTRRIAEVEFVRQCQVGAQSFAKESDIDADLDERLGAKGLSHAQWKAWHDALATSPRLVTQLTEVGRGGCPS